MTSLGEIPSCARTIAARGDRCVDTRDADDIEGVIGVLRELDCVCVGGDVGRGALVQVPDC